MMKSVCLVTRLPRSRIKLIKKRLIMLTATVAVGRAVMMRVIAVALKRCLRKGMKRAKIND